MFHKVPGSTKPCQVTQKKRIVSGEVDIEVAGSDWWLVIENKIDAAEAEGQTEKYADCHSFAGKRFFAVFLTRDGRRAQSRKFRSMSYRTLREVLEEVSPALRTEQFMVRNIIDQILYQLESL